MSCGTDAGRRFAALAVVQSNFAANLHLGSREGPQLQAAAVNPAIAMCLIVVGWRAHADYPLVVAANRDEFYARPTADAAAWPDAPEVFGGIDLEAGGTWLGIPAMAASLPSPMSANRAWPKAGSRAAC
jgi:hypothetical protein